MVGKIEMAERGVKHNWSSQIKCRHPWTSRKRNIFWDLASFSFRFTKKPQGFIDPKWLSYQMNHHGRCNVTFSLALNPKTQPSELFVSYTLYLTSVSVLRYGKYWSCAGNGQCGLCHLPIQVFGLVEGGEIHGSNARTRTLEQEPVVYLMGWENVFLGGTLWGLQCCLCSNQLHGTTCLAGEPVLAP